MVRWVSLIANRDKKRNGKGRMNTSKKDKKNKNNTLSD